MKLTELAHKTLEAHFQNKGFEPDKKTKEEYKGRKACFVTLTKDGDLRGCVGSLEARQELWRDVIENAISAGFYDSRFLPLRKEELKKVRIGVSVLSAPKKLDYKNAEDLLKKINKKMGIILKKDFHSATFLPQVWEQISDKTNFLEQLSLKAGLNRDAWKTADISFYTVGIEKENL